MRILKARVYNAENEAYADIELPASYEELQDILQMVNCSNENCVADIQSFHDDFNSLEHKTIQPCSLYELNYFATLVNNLDDYQKMQFAGLVEVESSEYPTMKELINLALNIPSLDCYHAPAISDKDLGEFYIDNELLPQLADFENLPDEQCKWVCEHLDAEKFGREMREMEKGVFTCVGYFIKNEEVKQLYDGNPIIPKPCDYIFRLELALIPEGDEPNDQHTLNLKLPASVADVQRALEEIGAKSMEDCCFYGYESLVVPQLADCYGDNEEFETLNILANKINRLDKDELAQYKAMLEAVECKDIETAVSVYEKMEDFTLDRNGMTASDYVDKVLDSLDLPLKEQFDFYLSKDGYGKALMKHNGVDQTSYGLLIPNAGIRLSEQIKEQSQDMDMTMSM